LGRGLDAVEALILKEVQLGDKVNLMKFCDIVDLFFYLPMQKVVDKNDSKDVYFILSSNVYGGHTNTAKDQGGALKKMLDLLWIKLDERFKGMAEAYRYFDVNFNNRVSFNEFQKGLDHLRIKYQVNQVDAIFKYLDRGQKEYISFGDFSELAEERRRHLDPFDATAQEAKRQATLDKRTWIQDYLADAPILDLEAMSKRKNQKGSNVTKRTAETQYMTQLGGNLPPHIKQDLDFRFGRSSGAYDAGAQRIGGIINYDYLREHMLESIA